MDIFLHTVQIVMDLFPQTDKDRKMTQNPIDIFPRTDESKVTLTMQ